MSKPAEASPAPVAWFWPELCEAGYACGGLVDARVRVDGEPIYICQAHAEAPPYRTARRVDVDWLR